MTEVDGRLELAPEPLLAQSGAAYRIGGSLHATLEPRAGGWALDVRQEVHSESLDNLRTLVDRLAAHADGAGEVGFLRFYEEGDRSPMVLRDGEISCADF
ncbi:hypothetical protein Val02_34210 [Virgisporangium aliadipatigenens]|uniref:Uncharacterized protein n=1 Tax=Virgisporangium aliadipatigenens TaxID=741659 RepID=A0A8J3YM96_9ACTN|nr:hypothetical protein [Virgisporangium aliadipatigenens]GIJ46535.1 hypothetical protein Val02_34210 [Virgisporangium aliadipatigenens]